MEEAPETWLDQIRPGGLIPELLGAGLLLYIPMREEWDGQVPELAIRLRVSGVPGGIPYRVSTLRIRARMLEFFLKPSGQLAERWHARQSEEDVRMATITIASGDVEGDFGTIQARMRQLVEETKDRSRFRLIRGGLADDKEASTRVR